MTDLQFEQLYEMIFLCAGFLRVLIVSVFFIAGHLAYLIYIKGSEK